MEDWFEKFCEKYGVILYPFIIAVMLYIFIGYPVAKATYSSPISRTNNNANSVLTSSKYNSDLNTVYTHSNDLDGSCITDATITDDKLDPSTLGPVINGIQLGCNVEFSDSATVLITPCQIGIDNGVTNTTSNTSVTWGCTGCASEATGTQYYVYATTSSTSSVLDLKISTTAPGDNGYNSTDRALGRFYNNANGDIATKSLSVWAVNRWDQSKESRDWSPHAVAVSGETSDPAKNASPVLDNGKFKREGEFMLLKWDYIQTSGGSSGSNDYYFSLPGGYEIDDTNFDVSSTTSDYRGTELGTGRFNNATAQRLSVSCFPRGTTAFRCSYGGTNMITSSVGLGTADWRLSVFLKIPIKGFELN